VPVEVKWENHLEGTLPAVTVVRVPDERKTGVPVCMPAQDAPALSGDACGGFALPGISGVHLHWHA